MSVDSYFIKNFKAEGGRISLACLLSLNCLWIRFSSSDRALPILRSLCAKLLFLVTIVYFVQLKGCLCSFSEPKCPMTTDILCLCTIFSWILLCTISGFSLSFQVRKFNAGYFTHNRSLFITPANIILFVLGVNQTSSSSTLKCCVVCPEKAH